MKSKQSRQGGMTRRGFMKSAAAGAAMLTAGGTLLGNSVRAAGAPSVCDGSRDFNLINGRFLTMDAKNPVASAVAIRDGRIVQVGSPGALGPCGRTVNLRGATVIPGLIDSHVHFIRDCLNPGHGVRIIETAQSIAELQQMITARVKQLAVPIGEFVTCIGGWNINGLAERRLPTLQELNAAAPQHPVFLTTTGAGGGVTNSAGKAFFESRGVVVSDAGTLAPANGFIALRQAELAGDPRVSTRAKGTEEVMDFTASLGMTSVHDVGGNGGFAGNPTLFLDLKPYEQAMDLWRRGDLKVRVRLFLWSDHDNMTAIVRMQQSLRRLGDDLFRVVGIGERTNTSLTSAEFVDNCEQAALHNWTVHQHSSTPAEINFHISAYEAGNAVRPIKDLRWQLTHVNSATDAQLDRLIAIGTGVTVQGTHYTSGAASAGTPFRRILDRMGAAGIPVGGGSDATNVGPFNPWLMMYFMITGKNNAGNLINAGGAQNVSRMEALWTYTMGSAYYSFDDDRLGSIEPGKLADLAVLNDDPLTVSEERFKRLHSVLTFQGGKVVHGG
jgi:predicted amidohydrolase YtcJ